MLIVSGWFACRYLTMIKRKEIEKLAKNKEGDEIKVSEH